MNKMILTVVFLLIASLVIFAQPPREMTYQGYLTDNSGNAVTANLQLTFAIYDVQSGGTALWSEVHPSVAIIAGVFRVRLGSISALDLNFDAPYWLGIQVESDPELAPRIALTGVGYSFYSLKADSVDNLTDNSVATATIQDAAVTQAKLAPGVSLPPGGTAGGDLTGTYPNPTIADNAVGAAEIAAGAVGTSEVSNGSLTGTDIADEPGIAQEQNSTTNSITSTIMADIETIQITIPAAGYIVLEGRSIAWFGGTTGQNQLYMQIDETAGGSITSTHWTKAGLGDYSSTDNSFFTMSCTRTYFKSAGTYTFRLEAAEVSGNGSGNTSNLYQTQLKAAYYPTSYGNVATTVINTAGFENVEVVQPNLEAGDIKTSSAYKVNLRELEIKARKARLEAERAERELENARSMDR